MSLEQTIKDAVLAESADLDSRLTQLVRAGLMPANAIPLLRRGIAKIQSGLPLQGAERDVMANFLNALMFIVLGDDTIFNRARVGAKATYRQSQMEEAELEEAVVAVDDKGKVVGRYRNMQHAMEMKPGHTYRVAEETELEEGENKEMKDKDPCWKGYEMVGMKKKGGKEVPNCVPANEEVEQIDEISKGKAMKALQHASSDMTDKRGYTIQKKINKKWPEMKDHTGHAAYTAAFGRHEPGKTPQERMVRDKLADRAKTSYRMTKAGKANKTDLKARFRKEEAMADIAAITQMNESYRSTFNAALTQYGIKSPSELDEEKRKEFFNFVDQNYKKGDN